MIIVTLSGGITHIPYQGTEQCGEAALQLWATENDPLYSHSPYDIYSIRCQDVRSGMIFDIPRGSNP